MALHALELGLEALDALADDAPVGLELGLARAPEPDAASDAGEVGPHSGEARQHVFELRQLDLQLGFVAPRPGREDVEDDFGPVHDPNLELALEVGALDRAQLLVEDDQRGAGVGDRGSHLLHFAFADQRRGIGRRDLLRHAAHHFGTGGVHQPGELLEMFGHVARVARALAGSRDENRAFDRIANLNQCSDDSSSAPTVSARWKVGRAIRCG